MGASVALEIQKHVLATAFQWANEIPIIINESCAHTWSGDLGWYRG